MVLLAPTDLTGFKKPTNGSGCHGGSDQMESHIILSAWSHDAVEKCIHLGIIHSNTVAHFFDIRVKFELELWIEKVQSTCDATSSATVLLRIIFYSDSAENKDLHVEADFFSGADVAVRSTLIKPIQNRLKKFDSTRNKVGFCVGVFGHGKSPNEVGTGVLSSLSSQASGGFPR